MPIDRYPWTETERIWLAEEYSKTNPIKLGRGQPQHHEAILNQLISNHPEHFRIPRLTMDLLVRERTELKAAHTFLGKLAARFPDKFDYDTFELSFNEFEWNRVRREKTSQGIYSNSYKRLKQGDNSKALKILNDYFGGLATTKRPQRKPRVPRRKFIDIDANDDDDSTPVKRTKLRSSIVSTSDGNQLPASTIDSPYNSESNLNFSLNGRVISIDIKDQSENTNIQPLQPSTDENKPTIIASGPSGEFETIWTRLKQIQGSQQQEEQKEEEGQEDEFKITNEVLDIIAIDLSKEEIERLWQKRCLDDRRFLLLLERTVRKHLQTETVELPVNK